MIGHFPTAYPDELLYSICARYSSRVKYPSKKAIPHDIFGTINATAVVDFPAHLGSLVNRFPSSSHYTVNRLIDEHTLLPFFTPFLPHERVQLLRNDMIESNGSSIHMRLGIMANRIPLLKWLRFCPLCVRDDKISFEETYWHRLHQLPGVEVCPIHSIFLEDSGARIRRAKNSFQCLLAEELILTCTLRPLDATDLIHKVLLKIAKDAAWLLKQPSLSSTSEALRNRYLAVLIERGLASYSGCIRAGRLIEQFKDHYSASLLEHLHCVIKGNNQDKDNWLFHLVRKPKHTHHPLHHLLLITFLGMSAETFFALPEEIKFFGDSPWPCLNPAADHYREARISEYKISFRGPNHRPVATFQCDCGFTYARTGPDVNPEDRYRITKMKSFGPIWEQTLERYWADSSFSISEIAQRLGVDPITIRRYAVRCGLSFHRAGRKPIKPMSSTTSLRNVVSSETLDQKRQEYRDRWLSAMKKKPAISMKSLRRELPRVYAWLLKNDADWLKAHRPTRPMREQMNSSVDWGWRDAKLAFFIWSKAIELLNAPGKPAFLSKTAICNSLGITSLIRQKIQKLPLTAAALADTAESRVEYALRRVQWAAQCYLQEETFPKRSEIIMRANVYRWRKILLVRRALKAAMEMLEQDASPLIKLSAC